MSNSIGQRKHIDVVRAYLPTHLWCASETDAYLLACLLTYLLTYLLIIGNKSRVSGSGRAAPLYKRLCILRGL